MDDGMKNKLLLVEGTLAVYLCSSVHQCGDGCCGNCDVEHTVVKAETTFFVTADGDLVILFILSCVLDKEPQYLVACKPYLAKIGTTSNCIVVGSNTRGYPLE